MSENKNAKTPADDGQPVAWMHNFIENNVITHIPANIGRHPDRWTALYKDPTPCKTCQALAMAVMNDQTYHEKVTPKQWVGLTDEEISIIWRDIDGSEGMLMRFARSIEAKLKDKNNEQRSYATGA
jgi:hypothetical protein